MPPPERIDLRDVGVALRRYHVDDLDALHTAIEESRDHLRPFMPWADQTRADTAAFLATAVEHWDDGTDFNSSSRAHRGRSHRRAGRPRTFHDLGDSPTNTAGSCTLVGLTW